MPVHAQATIAQCECNRRVTGAQLIAQPPELWTALLGIPHHRHDAGISRIDGQARRPERERVLSIDRAGEHLGSGSLRHHERLPGQVRLVHDTLAVDDQAVNRTDLVRVHDQLVVDCDVVQRHVRELSIRPTMSDERHATRERLKHR